MEEYMKKQGFKRIVSLILVGVLLFSLISAVVVSVSAQSEPTEESATVAPTQPGESDEEEGGINWTAVILAILGLIAIHFFTFKFMFKKK
jgi:hypothetical protein